jgi:hypothetical protein
MAYGNAQRLGENINPQLMQVDFSPYERAGATTGNAIANIGQQVGGAIKQYGEDEKTIKKSAQMAKSIRDAIPELAGMADNALAELSNPDLSQRDRLAIAEGIQDSLKIGVMGLENKRSNAMMQLEAAKIQASMQGKARNIMTADELQQQIQSGAKVKYVPLGNGMYEVESATANELPMFGNVTVGPDGKIQQAPSGGGNIRIPGAGSSVQNALPQAQGGSFPDNVAPTGLPIDQAAGFTPGVSVDGTPGVLPPRQQPMIPVGEVPKGDVYNLQGGQVEVTRLPGSSAELDFQIKEAELKAKEEKAKSEQTISEQAKTASEKQKLSKSNFLIDKANEAEAIIKNDISKYGVVGTNFDIGKSKVAGTPEYSLVNQILPALKDSIALSALQKLKDSSPTGSSGLGAVTEKEGKRLENMYGVLDVGGDKEILLKDLQRLKEESFDMIHGSKSERNQALKDGRITKDQNDQVEQMYNEQILGRKPRVAMDNPFTLDQRLDKDIDNFLNQ